MTSLVHKFDGLSLQLLDDQGKLLSRFDLSKAEIPRQLATELLRALATEFGHTSLETHRQTFRCIRKFIAFLIENQLNESLPLPASIATDMHRWLAGSVLAGSTAASHQNAILAVLKWCSRNSHGLLSKRTNFVVPSFRRQKPKERSSLDEKDVRAILAACYKEIESVESTRSLGDRLLAGKYKNQTDAFLGTLLADLLVLGAGKIPSQHVIYRGKLGLAGRVGNAGGLTPVRDLLYVSPRSMFPFYLAIICQTGGNPSPIAHLHVDCIKPHPIRSDIEMLVWFKPRALAEQKAEFSKEKQWAAPSLIRRYLALTVDMRKLFAEGRSIDELFIAAPHGGPFKVAVPCAQLMHRMLDNFIVMHSLRPFDFKDLRTYSALAHRQASGTMLAAKRKLNHRHVGTTSGYISPTAVDPEHNQYIHSFQGRLVSMTRQASGEQTTRSDKTGGVDQIPNERAAATIFGFDCADPLGGLGGHSPKGTTCIHFTKCATCPGAIVPVDDPRIVANLLVAKLALDAAKLRSFKEGWVARFDALYQPTLGILEQEILPAISNSVQLKAQTFVRAHYIPHLE